MLQKQNKKQKQQQKKKKQQQKKKTDKQKKKTYPGHIAQPRLNKFGV